jgi:hypothetical protein
LQKERWKRGGQFQRLEQQPPRKDSKHRFFFDIDVHAFNLSLSKLPDCHEDPSNGVTPELLPSLFPTAMLTAVVLAEDGALSDAISACLSHAHTAGALGAARMKLRESSPPEPSPMFTYVRHHFDAGVPGFLVSDKAIKIVPHFKSAIGTLHLGERKQAELGQDCYREFVGLPSVLEQRSAAADQKRAAAEAGDESPRPTPAAEGPLTEKQALRHLVARALLETSLERQLTHFVPDNGQARLKMALQTFLAEQTNQDIRLTCRDATTGRALTMALFDFAPHFAAAAARGNRNFTVATDGYRIVLGLGAKQQATKQRSSTVAPVPLSQVGSRVFPNGVIFTGQDWGRRKAVGYVMPPDVAQAAAYVAADSQYVPPDTVTAALKDPKRRMTGYKITEKLYNAQVRSQHGSSRRSNAQQRALTECVLRRPVTPLHENGKRPYVSSHGAAASAIFEGLVADAVDLLLDNDAVHRRNRRTRDIAEQNYVPRETALATREVARAVTDTDRFHPIHGLKRNLELPGKSESSRLRARHQCGKPRKTRHAPGKRMCAPGSDGASVPAAKPLPFVVVNQDLCPRGRSRSTFPYVTQPRVQMTYSRTGGLSSKCHFAIANPFRTSKQASPTLELLLRHVEKTDHESFRLEDVLSWWRGLPPHSFFHRYDPIAKRHIGRDETAAEALALLALLDFYGFPRPAFLCRDDPALTSTPPGYSNPR